jgi:hypothetical protein
VYVNDVYGHGATMCMAMVLIAQGVCLLGFAMAAALKCDKFTGLRA